MGDWGDRLGDSIGRESWWVGRGRRLVGGVIASACKVLGDVL